MKDTHKTLRSDLIKLYRKALASGMSLEELEKQISKHEYKIEVSEIVEQQLATQRADKLKKNTPTIVRLGAFVIPLVFIGTGTYLVGSAVFPILSYYITTSPLLQANNLTSPIPKEEILDVNPLIVAQAQEQFTDEEEYVLPTFINTELDYTNLSNWFDDATKGTLVTDNKAQPTTYTVDIPSLNISNAEVAIGGTDLNKSLIAYPGTALPGQVGSPVIFGHSVLRQFYNPNEKNPRRYNSIFSTIMTLKPGDKIYTTIEGVKYTYIVQDKTEVKPTDVHILAQKYDSKTLKLVTCVPEGTYLRRGVITAVLVEGG